MIGGCSPGKISPFISDLTDVEPVAQKVEQRTPKGIDPAELEIAPKDQSDLFGLMLHDGNLAVLHIVAEGEGTAHPKSLALGSCDLVPDPLGRDLPLELSKGQQHVER
jgi:hypothetical protein